MSPLPRGSITARIVVAILLLILFMGAAVYLLANRGMVRIVDDSARQLYGDRLRGTLGLFGRLEERLAATGNREAYERQFQELALRNLAAMEEGSPSPARVVVYGAEKHILLWVGRGDEVSPGELPAGLLPLSAGTQKELKTASSWGIFQRFPEWGWTVGYLMPIEAKYADVTRFREGFALLLLTAVAGAGLIGLLLVSSIVRPITRLTKAAAAMAKGDLNQPIRDGHTDEVGVLVAAFLRLQDAVRERIEELARNNDALGREVEDRKRAEEALQKALTDLERQNEELKVLDRVKDGLIRDVTHELKTPVAKFRMQTELLRDFLRERGLEADAAGLLEVVDRSIGRQEGVIRNILNLARLEGGGSRFRMGRVDLAGLVGAVVEEFADQAAACGVELQAALEPVMVTGDPDILRHAVANLVDNAIKFRNAGPGAWLRLRTGLRGGVAEISVEDNGLGMTQEERDHAFERFFQGSASVEGSGVGLAIVRRIIADHGGTIHLASAGRGMGTQATVTLPLAGASGG
jgi:signal transduction histidine kinase